MSDRPDPFPGDTFLRQYGFVVVGRPPGQLSVWSRGGREYTETEAHDLANILRTRELKKIDKE